MEGRVEICYGNVWYGVCADSYYYNNPNTICKALGYSQGIAIYILHVVSTIMCLGSGHYGTFIDLTSLPLLPYEFYCYGYENSLLDCEKYVTPCYYSYYYYYYYENYDYYSVTCQGK